MVPLQQRAIRLLSPPSSTLSALTAPASLHWVRPHVSHAFSLSAHMRGDEQPPVVASRCSRCVEEAPRHLLRRPGADTPRVTQ